MSDRARGISKQEAYALRFADAAGETAAAAIVAREHVSDCDPAADHFNVKTGPIYLLAWSSYTMDIFPEMRKAAAMFAGTEHLATAPDPEGSDEHREKHRDGGGGGYYLKAEGIYSSGWTVSKVQLTGLVVGQIVDAIASGRSYIAEKGGDEQ